MGKNLSGAQKRKKKREKEEAVERARANMERLKLGPTKLWTGLVTHHKDVFVSHVLSKLNGTDRYFFSKVNRESWEVLKYAGVNVSELHYVVHECTSISTLEWAWNIFPWGVKDKRGEVMDQAWFCEQVAATNKLEFLKWAREVKQCEWDERTIKAAAFAHVDILKYLVEERKTSEEDKCVCVYYACTYGRLDCLQYLVEEAKVPLDNWRYIANARYHEQPDCENYLREKGCPEPTDEEYAECVEDRKEQH